MAHIIFNQQSQAVNTIYCIGRNYVDHITELQNETPTEPVVFLKPNNSIICQGETINLPAYSQSVHYECELVLFIGQHSDGIKDEQQLLNTISACAVGLDLTARDIQSRLKEKGLPWTKAKGFRGAACLSNFVDAHHIHDWQNCHFELQINGQTRQQGNTALMIYPIIEILKELASTYGLRAGDIIFTGTPAGVGELHSGDILHLSLENLVSAEFKVA